MLLKREMIETHLGCVIPSHWASCSFTHNLIRKSRHTCIHQNNTADKTFTQTYHKKYFYGLWDSQTVWVCVTKWSSNFCQLVEEQTWKDIFPKGRLVGSRVKGNILDKSVTLTMHCIQYIILFSMVKNVMFIFTTYLGFMFVLY